MGVMKWLGSLFGCGCGGRSANGGGQTVLVRALTVAPDQPLTGDMPGTIQALGNDFIYDDCTGDRFKNSGSIRTGETRPGASWRKGPGRHR